VTNRVLVTLAWRVLRLRNARAGLIQEFSICRQKRPPKIHETSTITANILIWTWTNDKGRSTILGVGARDTSSQ
jgi:hypothetical protein